MQNRLSNSQEGSVAVRSFTLSQSEPPENEPVDPENGHCQYQFVFTNTNITLV